MVMPVMMKIKIHKIGKLECIQKNIQRGTKSSTVVSIFLFLEIRITIITITSISFDPCISNVCRN